VAEKLRDGIWTVALPFPDGTGRSTLTYLIEGSDGSLTTIDPGWDAVDELDTAIRSIGHAPDDVTLAVATHLHVDHIGDGTRWLERGVPLALHRAEQSALGSINLDTDPDNLARWGVPAELRHEIAADSASGRPPVGTTAAVVLEQGDALPIAGRDIRVLWTPGHTPGSVCLLDADDELFFSGDHVLPHLHPGLGLGGPSTRNPVDEFLDSLALVRDLGDVEVAPGHEYRFRGLAERCDAQSAKQLERSDAVAAALDTLSHPTVWDLTATLPWRRGFDSLRGHFLGSALAQTEFHVDRLGRSGEVVDARR
jgi:glyoxylase-like metal-dependent hydrolase (beta-lactamase superfamily II)